MTAPFFFKRSGGLTLREIASLVAGEPREGANLDRRISGIAPLDRAASSELSFLDSGKYAQQAAMTAANKASESGLRSVDVRVSGPGSGRESAVRALSTAGIEVRVIRDVTPIPHNGCRPPKKRRV